MRCAPGRSRTARPRSTQRAPSTRISPRVSSAPRLSPTRTLSRSVRWPRRARPVASGPRERPIASATGTSWRSSSRADPSVQAAARIELDDDRLVVEVLLLVVIVIVIVLFGVGHLDLGPGEEVLRVIGADVDRSDEGVVPDEDEAVFALELHGDRLDEGIVGVGVLDPATDRLDELEELVGLPFGLADDDDLAEDLVVALAQLVEEHVGSR